MSSNDRKTARLRVKHAAFDHALQIGAAAHHIEAPEKDLCSFPSRLVKDISILSKNSGKEKPFPAVF